VVVSDALAVAADAAREAGALLLERYGHERVLATKSSPTDLVSEADIAAEGAIRARLQRHFPDDAILGEEGDDVAGTSGRRWIVDPLDGTTNYLYGIPQWAVSIACGDEAGVVYDAVRDELFAVGPDGPATLNGVALAPTACDDLSRALVGTGFGYEARVRAAQGAVAARVLPRVRDLRRNGAAALDLAWVAAGRLDAFYERGIKPWDTAAGALLCARVGLDVRRLDADGTEPAGILVAPAAIADELLGLLSPPR
jgi:myo-inositol-1(or 4)-monophosphatase